MTPSTELRPTRAPRVRHPRGEVRTAPISPRPEVAQPNPEPPPNRGSRGWMQ